MGIFFRDKSLNKPFEDLSKETDDSKISADLVQALNPLIEIAWKEEKNNKNPEKGVAYCRKLWQTKVKSPLTTEGLFLNALKLAKAGENANKGWFSRLNGKSLQSAASRVFIALLKTQSGMVNIIKKDETHKLSDILNGVNNAVDEKTQKLRKKIATNETNKISKNFLDYVGSNQPSNFNNIAKSFSDAKLDEENKKQNPQALNKKKKEEKAHEQSVQAKLENQKKENEKEKKKMQQIKKENEDNREKAKIAYALIYKDYGKNWWNKARKKVDKLKEKFENQSEPKDLGTTWESILESADKELIEKVKKIINE